MGFDKTSVFLVIYRLYIYINIFYIYTPISIVNAVYKTYGSWGDVEYIYIYTYVYMYICVLYVYIYIL